MVASSNAKLELSERQAYSFQRGFTNRMVHERELLVINVDLCH